MIRVRSAVPLDGYRLHVTFSDGVERIVDVERYLRGPVFDTVRRDRATFEAVSVDSELGVVTWPGGADIDANVLYGRFQPAWADAAEDAA